jgi:cold shock protein
MARITGTVKWFSDAKGYGFIERADGDDLFVHHASIEGTGFKTLKEGERVEFEVLEEEKGPKAQSVVRLDATEDAGRRARAFQSPLDHR